MIDENDTRVGTSGGLLNIKLYIFSNTYVVVSFERFLAAFLARAGQFMLILLYRGDNIFLRRT